MHHHGLYGLTRCCGLSPLCGLFFVLTWRSPVYALGPAVFSAIVFAVSPCCYADRHAGPDRPFMLVTWLFLLPKSGFRMLQPVALADVSTAENTRASYRIREAGPGATPQPGEAT